MFPGKIRDTDISYSTYIYIYAILKSYISNNNNKESMI